MELEIVTHCWRYWRCLTYQAAAIYHHPPAEEISLLLNVVTSQEDQATCRRLQELVALSWPENVRIKTTFLQKERLFRRGIGRNQVALETNADVVWFTDCDYLIHGSSIIDVMQIMSQPDHTFIYPKRVYGTTHETGFELIQDASQWQGPPEICRSHFTEVMRLNRAIGGVQIVSGDLCRKYGYLKDSKEWDKPASRWKRAYEDVHFRKFLNREGHQARKVKIGDVLRIRHPVAGRDDPDVEL